MENGDPTPPPLVPEDICKANSTSQVSAWVVLVAMAFHANKADVAYPSVDPALVDELGGLLGERAIRRALDANVDAGFLELVDRRAGQGRTRRYRVAVGDSVADSPVAPVQRVEGDSPVTPDNSPVTRVRLTTKELLVMNHL